MLPFASSRDIERLESRLLLLWGTALRGAAASSAIVNSPPLDKLDGPYHVVELHTQGAERRCWLSGGSRNARCAESCDSSSLSRAFPPRSWLREAVDNDALQSPLCWPFLLSATSRHRSSRTASPSFSDRCDGAPRRTRNLLQRRLVGSSDPVLRAIAMPEDAGGRSSGRLLDLEPCLPGLGSLRGKGLMSFPCRRPPGSCSTQVADAAGLALVAHGD